MENAAAMADEFNKMDYDLVSNGTDNHLMLIDLRNKGKTGKIAEKALDKARITVNKNMVPFDDQSPFITSGIRIGTPFVTTRGLGEEDVRLLARLVDKVITSIKSNDYKPKVGIDESIISDEVIAEVRAEVKKICDKYPLIKK